MRRHVVMLMIGALLTLAGDASAQMAEWTDKGYANVNFGFGGSGGELDAVREFTLYAETGRVSTEADLDGGPFFDISGGARVWRNMSVGIGFHRVSSDGDVAVNGSVPHPIFFSRPRDFSTTVQGLERSERAVHLSVGYMIVLNENADVLVFGGPSFFHVSQQVISDVQIGEQGAPFNTVVANPTVDERSDSPVGGHIGADFTYRFYNAGRVKLGAGAFLRYAGASADLRVLDSDVSTDLGGFQVGFGLRTRF